MTTKRSTSKPTKSPTKKLAKAATKAAPRKKTSPAKPTRKTAAKPTAKPVKKTSVKKRQAATTKKTPKKKMPAKDRQQFRGLLMTMRDRLVDQIRALKGDSLTRDDSVNSEEDGTDAFERQFALELARSENDLVFEIDEALRRLGQGEYGICEECDCLIGKARLKALPFTRMCIECKSAQENGTHANSARLLLDRLG